MVALASLILVASARTCGNSVRNEEVWAGVHDDLNDLPGSDGGPDQVIE